LLIAVEPDAAEALLTDLHASGVSAATQIGVFTANTGRIEVA
jgi:hydrogenase maturation factor